MFVEYEEVFGPGQLGLGLDNGPMGFGPIVTMFRKVGPGMDETGPAELSRTIAVGDRLVMVRSRAPSELRERDGICTANSH